LLSLGADPNYTNGKRTPSQWPMRCMRRRPFFAPMLEAGGNPNARNEFGEPMIPQELVFGLLPNDQRARLDLSSITAPMSIPRCRRVRGILPVIRCCFNRTKMGLDDKLAYADTLTLSSAAPIRIVPGLTE